LAHTTTVATVCAALSTFINFAGLTAVRVRTQTLLSCRNADTNTGALTPINISGALGYLGAGRTILTRGTKALTVVADTVFTTTVIAGVTAIFCTPYVFA